MSEKLTALDHLQSCAQAAKDFTNSLVSELATSTAEALEEVDSRVDSIEAQIGGFSYDQTSETLTIPAKCGTVADETLTLV